MYGAAARFNERVQQGDVAWYVTGAELGVVGDGAAMCEDLGV